MQDEPHVVLRSLNGHVEWSRVDKPMLVQSLLLLFGLYILHLVAFKTAWWVSIGQYVARIAWRDYGQEIRGFRVIVSKLFGFYSAFR